MDCNRRSEAHKGERGAKHAHQGAGRRLLTSSSSRNISSTKAMVKRREDTHARSVYPLLPITNYRRRHLLPPRYRPWRSKARRRQRRPGPGRWPCASAGQATQRGENVQFSGPGFPQIGLPLPRLSASKSAHQVGAHRADRGSAGPPLLGN